MYNIVEKIKTKFEMIDWTAKERVRLLKDLFNFSDDEIEKLLQTHTHIFTCFTGDLIEAKTALQTKLNFSDEIIKSFVSQTENFPQISNSIDTIKEKIEMLNSMGVSISDISRNFEILKKNKEEIALRTKLAFINHLPIETFTYAGHYVNSTIIWSRMKAVQKGLCLCDKIYNNFQFNKNCKYSVEQLTKLFPLDKFALDKIELLYNKAKSENPNWKSSYKSFVRYETDPSNNFVSNIDHTKKINDTLSKVNSFSDNTIKQDGNHLSQYETEHKLAEFFNISVSEVNNVLNEHPELFNANIFKFGKIKEALQKDCNLTNEQLFNIFKAKPSIFQKTIPEYIAYKTFLKEFLRLDGNKFKHILTLKPQILAMNPIQLAEGCQTIKNLTDLPLCDISSRIIYYPEVYILPNEQLTNNIKTYLNMGIDKKLLLTHITGLKVNPNELELKLMLSRINESSDADFLKDHHSVDIEKVYARTMFNLENDLYLPIYRSDIFYAKTLILALNQLGHDINLSPEEIKDMLNEKYPLTEQDIIDVKKLYHSMKKDNNNLEDQIILGEN